MTASDAILAALTRGPLAWPALLRDAMGLAPEEAPSAFVDAADELEERAIVDTWPAPGVIGGMWELANARHVEPRGQLHLAL